MSLSSTSKRTKQLVEANQSNKTYVVLGVAYYLILFLTLVFLIWDNFTYGDKEPPQTIERFREATANILFFLTVSGFSIATRYIYNHADRHRTIKGMWWWLGLLYLASGIYWGYYYYMFTPTSRPTKTQTIIKQISMIYFIFISIVFGFVSCPRGCFKPFILPNGF